MATVRNTDSRIFAILRTVQLIYGAFFAFFACKAAIAIIQHNSGPARLTAFICSLLAVVFLMPPRILSLSDTWYLAAKILLFLFAAYLVVGLTYSLFHPELPGTMETWTWYLIIFMFPLIVTLQLSRASKS